MSLVDMETINHLGEEDNGNPAVNRIEFLVGYAIASAGCPETRCFVGGSGWLMRLLWRLVWPKSRWVASCFEIGVPLAGWQAG